MSTADSVPSWVTAVNAAPGSSQPASAEKTRRWALEEIGRNSVSPCSNPRTTASNQDMNDVLPTRTGPRPGRWSRAR